MTILKRILRFLFMLFFSKILYFRKKVKISPSVFLSRTTNFEGMNVVHANVNICNATIGYASYVGQNCLLANTVIGKFCSIGSNVKVLPYTHPTELFVSTHPSFFSVLKQSGFTFVEKQQFNENLYFNEEEKIFVKIGNDVWIGDDVKIMGGIEISDGAIIAAGSIVTKNVLPYSIVGGIPAKLIRFRFNEEQIKFLLQFKWWNKPTEWLNKNADSFKNIDNFNSNFNNSF